VEQRIFLARLRALISAEVPSPRSRRGQHHDAVRHRASTSSKVVRGQDHGAALLDQPADLLPDQMPRADVEARRWVRPGKKKPGIAADGKAQTENALLLSAGKRTEQPFSIPSRASGFRVDWSESGLE